MPVSFETMEVGEAYSRPHLAELWGYAGYEAISRGSVTPKGTPYIILFITKEKQSASTQYQDHFDGEVLEIEGPNDNGPDQRIINAATSGDEVHLFYRVRHHMDFTYFGKVTLLQHQERSGRPTHFKFRVNRWEAQALSDIRTEIKTQTGQLDGFGGAPEGERRQRTITVYERDPRNRAKALEIHGTKCAVCEFDFNAFYGEDLARDFIQIHHVRSITQQGGRPINPEIDLVPLCSNCHSMSHRKSGLILSVGELKAAILRNGI
jgi:5-methylcytosine-specific restriction protein A